ncbi:MAG: hypothetical protein ACI81R_001076 [Bradymonadia bacterium]|jgi:hypothetical protein
MNDDALTRTKLSAAATSAPGCSTDSEDPRESTSDVLMRVCTGRGTGVQIALPLSVVFKILRASP